MLRTALLLFLLGATLGTALDAIHTHSGTTVYPHEIVFKMAWWTPLLFGAAAVAIGLGPPLSERFTKKPLPIVSWRAALSAFGIFVALYGASGWLPASNGVKLVVLAFGAAAVFAIASRSAVGLALALVAAAFGPLVEITLVSQGAFRHLQPDLLGIPIWLPALYAAGASSFGAVGRLLHSRTVGIRA